MNSCSYQVRRSKDLRRQIELWSTWYLVLRASAVCRHVISRNLLKSVSSKFACLLGTSNDLKADKFESNKKR